MLFHVLCCYSPLIHWYAAFLALWEVKYNKNKNVCIAITKLSSTSVSGWSSGSCKGWYMHAYE